MSDGKGTVRIEFERDAIVVKGAALDSDRQSVFYLGTLLGGTFRGETWSIPSRRRPLPELALQLNAFLARQGYTVSRDQLVEESVRRDEERRRSFGRTTEAAQAFRDGVSRLTPDQIDEQLSQAGWNFEARRLRDHQMHGVLHGLTVANPANFSVPGAGKTATTLALATIHHSSGTVDTVLVVGPLSSFRPWETETAAATGWLMSRRIRGDSTERRLRYRQVGPGELVIMSYATAAADRAQIIKLCERLQIMLVVDESHRVKRFRGGTWAPALMDIARHARVRTILSGTPMPQSGRDLYSQLNILWPGRELTGPRDPFAVEVRDRFDRVLNRVLPFVSRTPKSALGLTPPIIRRHSVELQSNEAEIYRLLEANLRRRVQAAGEGDRARIEALRRGRPLRLLQAATNAELLRRIDPGMPIPAAINSSSPTLLSRLDNFNSSSTPPAKILRALELLQQVVHAGKKAVVWGTFITNLDFFAALAGRRLQVPIFQVDGRVPTNDASSDDGNPAPNDGIETRDQAIASFLTTSGPAVLVANPASCSESISLHTACHTAIYLDRTYDCAQWLQSIDRIHRLGLDPSIQVEIHVIQAIVGGQQTADGLVDSALQRKEMTMRQLLEGSEIRPLGQRDDPAEEAEGDEEDLRSMVEYLLGAE